MIKQSVTYYPDSYNIKEYTELFNDKLTVKEIYNEYGDIIYRETPLGIVKFKDYNPSLIDYDIDYKNNDFIRQSYFTFHPEFARKIKSKITIGFDTRYAIKDIYATNGKRILSFLGRIPKDININNIVGFNDANFSTVYVYPNDGKHFITEEILLKYCDKNIFDEFYFTIKENNRITFKKEDDIPLFHFGINPVVDDTVDNKLRARVHICVHEAITYAIFDDKAPPINHIFNYFTSPDY